MNDRLVVRALVLASTLTLFVGCSSSDGASTTSTAVRGEAPGEEADSVAASAADTSEAAELLLVGDVAEGSQTRQLEGLDRTSTAGYSAMRTKDGRPVFAATGNYGKYRILLASSPNIESFRAPMTTAAQSLAKYTGFSFTVAPGTITKRDPEPGEIVVVVEPTNDCNNDGCAGPALYAAAGGQLLARGGAVQFRPSVASLPLANRQLAAMHELGHTLGLNDMNGTYQDHRQVMNGIWNVSLTPNGYEAGDRAGLAFMSRFNKKRSARDLDCDGKADTSSMKGTTFVVVRSSDGKTVSSELGLTGGPTALYPGDMNGDGLTDVLLRSSGGTLRRARGDCSGKVSDRFLELTGWSQPLLVASRDFNGDKMTDLLAPKSDGGLYQWTWNGSSFAAKGRVGTGVGWYALKTLSAPGDIDGDGFDDLAATKADGTRWQYFGNGAGGLRAQKQVG